MNGLSLFAGIGGLDLGLERAGVSVVGQVEIDPFCRQVLAKHWPAVPRHDDVRTAADWWLNGEDRPHVDLVFGGFPCQDISNAGLRAGIDGERSGLWGAFADTVRRLRPRYVLLENVAALLARGAGRVLGELAEIGYDAEWDCVPAAAVGAPHLRDRWFCVAYAQGECGELRAAPTGRARRPASGGAALADSDGPAGPSEIGAELGAREAADGCGTPEPGGRGGGLRPVGDAASLRFNVRAGLRQAGPGGGRPARVFVAEPADAGWWAAEPDVGRVAYGVPSRLDRLRGLGNAVVPQVAEHIGRLLLDFDRRRAA